MQTLGKYQLIAEIARGGMGIVYLAVASGPAGFSKLFVIKELKPELVDDGNFFDMFLEEARLAARLSHPNIVTTYEVGVDGRRPFIVMDYLDGESLGRLVRKRSAQFTVPMHLRVLCHVLDGLEYAHHLKNFDETTASVVHRDMSPQNVFITFDGQVKIVDFGIAKSSDTSIETQAGIYKGKPGYMAPEQLGGDADTRADLFSVGVMVWEAVSGSRMFPKKTQLEILTALIKGEIPSLGDAHPGAPAELVRICDKATRKDPDERYATAQEMRADLEAYLESLDERVTIREISQIVATVFEPQRKQLRAVIEKCITAAKSGAVPAKLPSLAPPPFETTTPRTVEHTVQMEMRTSDRVPVDLSPTSTRGTLSGTPDGSAFGISSQAPPAEKKSSRSGLLLLLAIALLVTSTLSIGLILLRDDRRAAQPAPALEARPGAAATAAAPAPSESPATAESSAAEIASARAAAVAHAAASASAGALAAQPRTRIIYLPAPPPRPTPPTTTAAPQPPPERPATPGKTADCNPPFYFEGTKKVFKPGCL